MNYSNNEVNKDNIIVSVVVPLYKGKTYIDSVSKMVKKALEHADIYEHSELIFVNDYPEEPLIDGDSWYTIYNNEKNMGIHGSRVQGLNLAHGRFIHFLDQDDKIKKEFYKIQIARINDKDVIVANALLEHENGASPEYRNAFERWLVKHPKMYGIIGCRIESPGQCLVKAESIPEIWKLNILENNGSDDLMLWLSMFAEKRTIGVHKDILYRHTYTGENLSLEENKMMASLSEMSERLKALYPNDGPIASLYKRVKYMLGEEKSLFYTAVDKSRDVVKSIKQRIQGKSHED